MSELKAFDVGLGRCTEDGYPCVVAYGADQNPRVLNEKVYLKDEADKVFAEKDAEIRKLNFQLWSARFEAAKAERDEPRMARCRYMADKFKEAKNEST